MPHASRVCLRLSRVDRRGRRVRVSVVIGVAVTVQEEEEEGRARPPSSLETSYFLSS